MPPNPRAPLHLAWRLCCVLAVTLMVLGFTPVFVPPGQAGPFWFGMPYTLWAGIGLCLAMVVLTFIATLVHPGGHKPR